MAIKINSKNLTKRVIDGKEVEKVILNWAEIRPNEVPHINYHVINDFSSWGSLPWWWSTSSWDVTISSDWVSSTTWQTAKISYTMMPSLANAKKIEIIYQFHRVPWEDINKLAIQSWLWPITRWGVRRDGLWWSLYYEHIDTDEPVSLCSGIITSDGRPSWAWWNIYSNPDWAVEWDYKLEITYYLEDADKTGSMPASLTLNWVEKTGCPHWTIRKQSLAAEIRLANQLPIELWQWTTLKQVDMFIYNNLPD